MDNSHSRELCLGQLENARCMTDAASAIVFVSMSARSDRQEILNAFYNTWKDEPLVVDKWLRAQATAPVETALETVISLTDHPGFDCTNPNKIYALILGFTHGNPGQFHAPDGSGYEFLFSWTKMLDPANPQVAARLVSALNSWNKYRPDLANKMKQTLTDISSLPGLSNDIREIVEKNLK